MTDTPLPHHDESLDIAASPEALYDLVSDVTRTGEWSPVCRSCWWDDEAEAGRVGAWFHGRNETPDRTWETRSQVSVADRGSEFAWIVGGDLVRWQFVMTPTGTGGETTLTESWAYLPGGIALFEEKFGDRAQAEIDDRTRQALDGIPRTLARIKEIAEAAVVRE